MALRSNFNSENGELSSEVLNLFLVLSLCTISFHDTQSSSFSLSLFYQYFFLYLLFCLLFISFIPIHNSVSIYLFVSSQCIFFFTYLVMPSLHNSLKILFLCLSLYLSISVYQSLPVYVSIDPFVFLNTFLVFSLIRNSPQFIYFSLTLYLFNYFLLFIFLFPYTFLDLFLHFLLLHSPLYFFLFLIFIALSS